MEILTQTFEAQRPYPNSPHAVRIYRQVWKPTTRDAATAFVSERFTAHGWSTPWVDTVYDYHHFHANAHEVLACVSGRATLQLGGPNQDPVTVEAGDVVVLPAGVIHKCLEADPDFRMAGSYPDGQEPDMHTGDDDEWDAVREAIAQTPLWSHDPITGDTPEEA